MGVEKGEERICSKHARQYGWRILIRFVSSFPSLGARCEVLRSIRAGWWGGGGGGGGRGREKQQPTHGTNKGIIAVLPAPRGPKPSLQCAAVDTAIKVRTAENAEVSEVVSF